jgi:hypothetical protein
MSGFLRSSGGRLTLVTLLLAVLASPLQPMTDLGATLRASESPCGLLAAVSDEGSAAAC